MKVFVLGGYGKVGVPVIELLAGSELVTEIAVAGRDLERARRTAAQFRKKAIALQADGTDEQMLASLLAGYDLVVNGSFNETVSPSIRAAIDSGSHYCDVSWGEAIDSALELAPKAKAAGVTAVIATGISPGISNNIGVKAAKQLDEVEQLQIGRADPWNFVTGKDLTPEDLCQSPERSLSLLQEFRSYYAMIAQEQQQRGLQKVVTFRDGWVSLNPLINGIDVPRLDNGTVVLYPIASSSDSWGTLPNDLAVMPTAELIFGIFPPKLQELFRDQISLMLAGKIDHEAMVSDLFDTISRAPDQWLSIPEDYALLSKMWVRSVGRKDGRAARYTTWFTTQMWSHTGWFLTSAALAALGLKLLRGELKVRGVMTAEKILEPESFLNDVGALLPEPLTSEQIIDDNFEWLE